MPLVQDFEGNSHRVPGVKATTVVSTDSAGPLPDYLIPVEMGQADQGDPYNVDSLLFGNEIPRSPFTRLRTSGKVAAKFGADSDITKGFKKAKQAGLPEAYVVCMSALTRGTVITTSGSQAVNQYKLYGKSFGAPLHFTKVKIAAGTTITVTPVKNHSLITADVGTTDKRIFVRSAVWVRDGMTLTFGDNTTTSFTNIVAAHGTDFDAAGQVRHWIDLTTTAGTAITTALFGMVFEYDETRKEVSPALDAQGQVDWFNDVSKILGATVEATFTNPASIDALAVDTPLREITVATWTNAVSGTSPPVTVSDFTAFITALDANEYDDFGQKHGVLPYLFYVADSNSVNHGAMRDWAITKRAEGKPVQICTGAGWGDVVLDAGDDTDPKFRASALNNQDVWLAVGGIDREGSHLSLAAVVFGLAIGGGVGHNLTNDGFQYVELETTWDERNSGELTALHLFGLIVWRLETTRYVVSEGLNTLQGVDIAWDVETKSSPLIMQRVLADFVQESFNRDLSRLQVGADQVTEGTVRATLRSRAKGSLEARGYIVPGSWRITSIVINAGRTGFDVQQAYAFPVTNDFIVIENTILT